MMNISSEPQYHGVNDEVKDHDDAGDDDDDHNDGDDDDDDDGGAFGFDDGSCLLFSPLLRRLWATFL